MKRKLLSVIIAILMIIQCAPFVSAAEPPADPPTDPPTAVSPHLDMEVKHHNAGAYKNGPLYITGTNATVDFKTTLNMSSVLQNFVDWYNTAQNIINNLVDLGQNRATLETRLNNIPITGQFTVKIYYPKTVTVPGDFLDGTRLDMYGFNDGAKTIFKEISRVPSSDANNNILTITIEVKGPSGPTLTIGELNTNKATYLADIYLEAIGIDLPHEGTYTAKGTMTGYIEAREVSGSARSLRVDYTGVQEPGANNVNSADPSSMSATVKVTNPPTSSGVLAPTTGSIIFNIDGDTNVIPPISKSGTVKPEDLPKPEKDGYTFDGWYYDCALTDPVDEAITLAGVKTLYGHWINNALESEDHFAYVIGYPDGTVRPENNITREEVATIFYRLLREKELIEIATDENSFTDVAKERWSNKAISTLAKGGYITGYEDGTFGPQKPITRAEFATMATRYANLTQNGEITFSDVSGHWAEEDIYKAASERWVNGYEDGTFAPEKEITRAEVMTIINRMLVRYVDAEGIHADATFWKDMTGNEWYYYNVLEATNSHDYDRREDGKLEKWTEITTNMIWVELDEMENAD